MRPPRHRSPAAVQSLVLPTGGRRLCRVDPLGDFGGPQQEVHASGSPLGFFWQEAVCWRPDPFPTPLDFHPPESAPRPTIMYPVPRAVTEALCHVKDLSSIFRV